MKNYLKKYRSLYGNQDEPLVFKNEDFEDLEKFINALPKRMQDLGPAEHGYYRNLPEFVNQLHDQDLFDLVQDILYEDPVCLATIFEPSKYASSSQNAFDWLINLPHASLVRMEKCLEAIFQKNFLSEKVEDKQVLKKIMEVSARNKTGLSSAFLMRKLETPDLGPHYRLDLLTLLANKEKEEQAVLKIFWQAVDVTKEPWLAPAVMAAYKYHHPIEALAVLTKIPANYVFEDDRIRKRLMRNVETTLSRMRILYSREHALRAFQQILPSIENASDLFRILVEILEQKVALENISDVFEPYRNVIGDVPYYKTIPAIAPADKTIDWPQSGSAETIIRLREKSIRTVLYELRNPDIKQARDLLLKITLNKEEKEYFIQRLDDEVQQERVTEEVFQYVIKYLQVDADKLFNQAIPKIDGTIKQIFDRLERENLAN